MAGSKVLVLGATGPTGINVLRELHYLKRPTIAYVRNPSKIPENLAKGPYIEVIHGEIDNIPLLSKAMSQSSRIISLLGPVIGDLRNISPSLFADMYHKSIFPLMRQHGVKRILAMGTVSIYQPDDQFSALRSVGITFVKTLFNAAYANIIAIQEVFEKEAGDLDWIVFRLGRIPGGHDEESWNADREDGKTFVGWVGEKGWTMSQKRGALARWLVETAEGGAEEWVRKMPAVSRLGGS